MKTFVLIAAMVVVSGAAGAAGQQNAPQQQPAAAKPAPQGSQPRPLSPRGSAEAHVGVEISKTDTRTSMKGGHWIEITYGRPLKRGRELWGRGESYGKELYANAPVWRAGADVSTRLKTEVPLEIGGKRIPGTAEYSLFVELKSPTEWTLIVSSYGAKQSGREETPGALWGAYNYTPDKDMVRVPMNVSKLPVKLEQLTWAFVDMEKDGGKIALMWDDVIATVPFKLADAGAAK